MNNFTPSTESYSRKEFFYHRPEDTSEVPSFRSGTLFQELNLEIKNRKPSIHSIRNGSSSKSRLTRSPFIEGETPRWIFEYCHIAGFKHKTEKHTIAKPQRERQLEPYHTDPLIEIKGNPIPNEAVQISSEKEDTLIPSESHTSWDTKDSSCSLTRDVTYKKAKGPKSMDQMKEEIFKYLSLRFRPMLHTFPLEFFSDEDQILHNFDLLSDEGSPEPGWTQAITLRECNMWNTEWVPCRVLHFDASGFRFQVQFFSEHAPHCEQELGSNRAETSSLLDAVTDSPHPKHLITKWVSRFNVYLCKEPRFAYDLFYQFALTQRKAFEARAQLWHHINDFNTDPSQPPTTRLPDMPHFLYQRFLSLFLEPSFSPIFNHKTAFDIHTKRTISGFSLATSRRKLRQAIERHLLEYSWHWRFVMKMALIHPLLPMPFSTPSDVPPLAVPIGSILPDDALIRIPGYWACIVAIRDTLSNSAAALVFPSSSCTLPFLFDQVMDMIEILDHEILQRMLNHIKFSISMFCGHQPEIYTRMKRLADFIVYEKLDQLQLIYMKMLCAHLQHGVAPNSIPYSNTEETSIEELLKPHVLHPYITPCLHLTWEFDVHHTKVFTDPSLDQTRRLIGELLEALHIKLINLPQFHDTSARYPFNAYIAEGLTDIVCAKIPEIHAMKPDLMSFLWLFKPPPTNLSMDELRDWLNELQLSKEMLKYYEVPYVGPFFRISIRVYKKEVKNQMATWDAYLTNVLQDHFKTLTRAMKQLELETLQLLVQCKPKRTPAEWHQLQFLLNNQPKVLDQFQLWTKALQTWWHICFDFFIPISDDDFALFWEVLGCGRRLNHEYAFSTELLVHCEQEYVKRLEIDDECIRDSVLEYMTELEQLTSVGEPKQIQEMVFRFQSLKGRAERLIQLFENTVSIRTHLNMRIPQTTPSYQTFHSTFHTYSQVWILAQTVTVSLQHWLHTVFLDLPFDSIRASLFQWQKELRQWTSQFPAGAPVLQLLMYLDNNLNQFMEPWAVAAALSNPHLQMRQWFQITKKTGLTAHDLEMLTLEQVYGFHLDLVYDLLIEHPSSANPKEPTAHTSENKEDAETAPSEVKEQILSLVFTYNLNSLRIEIHGPDSFWSNKKTITVPYSEIEKIELNPPEIQKYILREQELEHMYKKFKEVERSKAAEEKKMASGSASFKDPGSNALLASTSSALDKKLSTIPAHPTRKGIWHTKSGDQFFFLLMPKEEREKDEKDMHPDEQQEVNIVYQVQVLTENALALIISESNEIPFRKLIFTIPSTEISPESCKKKIMGCIQLQQLPEVENHSANSQSE